ncbi:MAG: sugar ABC transporter substrate-binding protein, partial [Alphaproteobacteria bacterium]
MFEKRVYSAAAAAALAIALGAASDVRAEKLGEGMVMYFQMGGVPGGGATLPRTNGARDAAEAFGVVLKEQYSAWQPEKMLNQFREAAAADPACIEIMGHPGNEAFEDLVAEARGRGIVVTSGNAPLTKLFELHQMGGFGYAGVDLYTGG